jgi:four helix bundle protein
VSEGYRSLEIYQRAHKVAVEIHRMTLSLPRHELFEEGGQIRRSSKSVAAQIVEGYCLRKNKNEFVQYLNRAFASCHESAEHLDLLFETGSLADRTQYDQIRNDLATLCKMIYRFMESIVEGHEKPRLFREDIEGYEIPADIDRSDHSHDQSDGKNVPTSPISHPRSG